MLGNDETLGASCPISGTKMDERIARVIAGLVVIIISLSMYFTSAWILVFLLLDFTSRAFFRGKGSLLRYIACRVVTFLPGDPKLTDVAPKRFAALLGVIFTGTIIGLYLIDLSAVALILSGLLLVLATLEASISLCVGCLIYQFFQNIKRIQTS